MKRRLKQLVTNLFHVQYYRAPASWRRNTFLGYPVLQCPIDLQIYQELVVRTRPRFIVQTGVAYGGSLLYFACLLDLIGAPPDSVVVGVDIALHEQAKTLTHRRIRLIEANSVDRATVARVRELLPEGGGLVSLDSNHARDHVLEELRNYREFVAPGGYLVAEDTNINGHPVNRRHGPGPREAVELFLGEERGFVRDDDVWKRHLFSFHQSGWLRRLQ